MFITPLYQQHASHTLASRVYGCQPHMRSSSATGPYICSDPADERVDSLGFMVSVRALSVRTQRTECGNEEGKQGEDLGDGVTNVFVTGREFEDVYPVLGTSPHCVYVLRNSKSGRQLTQNTQAGFLSLSPG